MADLQLAHSVPDEHTSNRNALIALIGFIGAAAAIIAAWLVIISVAANWPFTWMVLVFCGLFYFTPTMIANRRLHRNVLAIFVFQLVFAAMGLSFIKVLAEIGWAVAIIWAFTSSRH